MRGQGLQSLGGDEILSVQLRGEYLYAACGSGGLRVFDVAQIDQKGFSEITECLIEQEHATEEGEQPET